MWRSGFGRLWIAAVASNIGDGLVAVAFPLLAASITRDPVAISGLAVASGLPWLLFGPLAGAVVDRFDRRLLMWVFDLGRAVVVSGLALFLAFGGESLTLLYVVVFLIAAGETIVDTAAQAILPSVVDSGHLDRANGQLFSSMTVANRFVGPPLGGLMFAATAYLPVGADAASFAVAAIVIARLQGRFTPDVHGVGATPGLWTSTLEGLVWLWRNGPIRAFALGAALLNIGVVAGEAILVLFAQEQLGVSDIGFGALLVAPAVGYTLGSASASRVALRVDRKDVVSASIVGVALGLIVTGTAGHSAVAALAMAIAGVATGLWDVVAVSYRQAAVPDRLLGRVMAAYRFVAYGAFPIGALLGGTVARVAGNRGPFIVGAALALTLLPLMRAALRGVELDPAKIGSRAT